LAVIRALRTELGGIAWEGEGGVDAVIGIAFIGGSDNKVCDLLEVTK